MSTDAIKQGLITGAQFAYDKATEASDFVIRKAEEKMDGGALYLAIAAFLITFFADYIAARFGGHLSMGEKAGLGIGMTLFTGLSVNFIVRCVAHLLNPYEGHAKRAE